MTPARSSTARKRLADSRELPASFARSAWVARTRTSWPGSPGGLSRSDEVGLRLCHQLAQRRSHATLNRLEGAAREALVALPQAPGERDQQAHRDLGVLSHQAAHVRTQHGQHACRLQRLHRGRATLVLEQRQLPEDVARAERRQSDRAPVAMIVHRAGAADVHDVAGVAPIALAEHHLAGLEAPGHRQLGDALEVRLLQRREHRHAAEQLHDLR